MKTTSPRSHAFVAFGIIAAAAGLGALGISGCAAAPAAAEDGVSESDLTALGSGMCLPGASDAQFLCRVGHARDSGQNLIDTTVYESFGVNVRSADPAQITHAKAGWVRMGIDGTDKTPLEHMPTYAKRILAFHRQGIKVLFNVTEGLVSIPDRASGGGGDYAADSCSPDPAVAGLWDKCGMTIADLTALEDRWGITSSRVPRPKGDYMDRFEAALTSFVTDMGDYDTDARPDVWEIMNEPDNAQKTDLHPHGSQINVEVMGAILEVARRVVDAGNRRHHATGPKERLAFGALMMSSSWRMTKAATILASPDRGHPVPLYDLATFHVYVHPQDAGGIEGGTRSMLDASFGRPLMITEFGFESADGGAPGQPGDEAISTLMTTAYALKKEKKLPLEASFVWSWADGDTGHADHYGLTTAAKTCSGARATKASFVAFAKTAESIARSKAANPTCDAM